MKTKNVCKKCFDGLDEVNKNNNWHYGHQIKEIVKVKEL